MTNFTGKKPQGYTAPAWDASKELIPLLEEFGIVYDHSFMHHDSQPYFAPDASHQWIETDIKKEAETWMKPMTKIRPSRIVEIPANWQLDDCEYGLVFVYSGSRKVHADAMCKGPPLQPMPGRAGAVSGPLISPSPLIAVLPQD